jgi:uncharacterized protein with HEPN domain
VSRDLRLFLQDIETSCAKIIRYTEGLTRDQVFADEMRFDGVLLNLHVIGEAVKNLPLDLRERYPDIAWREIAGLRDLVAHAYFALDLEILWDAIQRDVPALHRRIRQISESEKEPGSSLPTSP